MIVIDDVGQAFSVDREVKRAVEVTLHEVVGNPAFAGAGVSDEPLAQGLKEVGDGGGFVRSQRQGRFDPFRNRNRRPTVGDGNGEFDLGLIRRCTRLGWPAGRGIVRLPSPTTAGGDHDSGYGQHDADQEDAPLPN